MKRLFSLLLTCVLLLGLCSCSFLQDEPKGYEGAPATFTFQGLTFAATDSFLPDEEYEEENSVWYTASDMDISVDFYPFAEAPELENMSTLGYAQFLRSQWDGDSPTEITEEDGLIYFSYEASFLLERFTYFLSFYRADDGFYIVWYMCDTEDFASYKPHFLEWAKAVTVAE